MPDSQKGVAMPDDEAGALRERVAALEAEIAALKQTMRELDQALHHLIFGTSESEWVAIETINRKE